MNKPLFEIIFEDNSTFSGGDYQNTKWRDIPDKKIKVLSYLLPTEDYLVLEGYEKFYHFIECTKDLNGNRSGIQNLEFDYLICKKINDSVIYKINLNTRNIEIISIKNDDVFLSKLNISGWK